MVNAMLVTEFTELGIIKLSTMITSNSHITQSDVCNVATLHATLPAGFS
jgi:hypothetical protein